MSLKNWDSMYNRVTIRQYLLAALILQRFWVVHMRRIPRIVYERPPGRTDLPGLGV